MTDRKILYPLFMLLLSLSAISAVRAVDDVFIKDQHLLAISHYNNIADTDKNIQQLFESINPQTPTTSPVISQFTENILLENIKDFAVEKWVEVLYFSQPLEQENDWVYAFHITDQQSYISSLLSTGNIRQEQTEGGITRYRKTEGLDSTVYYLATADNNLMLMSSNSAAVSKAMKLYRDADIEQDGLLSNQQAEYTLLIHLNRYFLVSSKVLPQFFNMLQTDILQDLAGATAKSDNILNIILGSFKKSLIGLINEMAILELRADTAGDNIRIKSNIDIQYGGSLHYALSAFDKPDKQIENLLPEGSVVFSEMQLWNEEYIQVLEGIAGLANTITDEQLSETTADEAAAILDLFQQVKPESVQQGILRPAPDQPLYGSAAVSVIKVGDSTKLSDLFTRINNIMTKGDFAEFIAEEGLRLTTLTKPLQVPAAKQANEIELSLRSTYFKLPEVLGRKQYLLSAITGNHLITVIPLAPLTEPQYLDTRPYCLELLNKTISSINNPNNYNQVLQTTAEQNRLPKIIYTLSFNPLHYLQTILAAEAIWPQPSAPNRLPIPWMEYSRFFSTQQSAGNSATNFTVNSDQTNISFTLTLPKRNISEVANSLLNFSPVSEY